MNFKYTEKQSLAVGIFNDPNKAYYLVEGGSRSGKTFLICDYIICRAIKYPNTRHLVCRQSKTSCVATVWKQTLLPILDSKTYNGGWWEEDKTNSIIKFKNGSSIWAGGFDNKQHEDAMLGSEWGTIFINEAVDMAYADFEKLQTRLQWLPVLSSTNGSNGQPVPLRLKLFADCNPKAPSHWLAKYFKRMVDPKTNEKLSEKVSAKIATVHFHPMDNKVNLSSEYLEQLESLSGLARQRFWEGIWAEDSEGLVYHAFDRRVNVVDDVIKYDPNAETFTAWDFGTADPTFIIVGQIKQIPKTKDNKYGFLINIIDEHTATNKDVNYYVSWIKSKEYFKNVNLRHYGDPAGKSRGAALDSWISLLGAQGIFIQYTGAYSVAELADCANTVVSQVRLCEKQTPKTVEMFENWKYPLESDGTKKIGSLPNHDEFSHCGTSFYYFTANRFGTKVCKCVV